jgi:hypothetical protein
MRAATAERAGWIHAIRASRKHLPMKTRRLVAFLVEAFSTPRW